MIPLLIEATIKCGSCNEYAKVKIVPTKEGHLIAKQGHVRLPKGGHLKRIMETTITTVL